MNRHLHSLLAVAIVVGSLPDDASARGFGGAGMFSGGASEFGGAAPAFGGSQGGAMQGGGFQAALGQGIQGGDLVSDSYQGGVTGSGFRAGNMKSDSFHVGDFGASQGETLGQGIQGGDLESDSYQGGVIGSGFRAGNMKSNSFRVGDFAAPTAAAAVERGRGLPTDAGLHVAGRPLAEAREVGAVRAAPVMPLSERAVAARTAFRAGPLFTPAWIADHPTAWRPPAAVASVYRVVDWPEINAWFGESWPENYYDFGGTIVVNNDEVDYHGRPVATAAAFAQAAIDLAETKPDDAPKDDQWLVLGVFGALRPDETEIHMVFQLAVDKQGILRGTYTNLEENHTQPIHGAVNRDTQRAAWSVGDRPDGVLDTGLYNLTKDEAPVLVHFGPQRTEQWLLVRIEQSSEKSAKK